MSNVQIHDTVFRDYFNDKIRLLSLCNAMLHTDCKHPSDIEINTLEGTFFSGVKNDISCLLRQSVVTIIEHQTSINANMPYRCFEYSHGLYQKITSSKRHCFYRAKQVPLPRPYFATIYEGKPDEFARRTLHLSDAFGPGDSPLELDVEVFNLARLDELPLSGCKYLRDYRTFVYRIDNNKRVLHMEPDHAVQEAVTYCMFNDIMADYLAKKDKEVFNMLSYEWNETEAHNAWKEEGREEGREEGLEEGLEEERENGIRALITSMKDLAISQSKTAEQLMKRYTLTHEEAMKAIQANW